MQQQVRQGVGLALQWRGERFRDQVPGIEPARELALLPKAPSLAAIRTLQSALAAGAAGPTIDLSPGLAHYFAPGMYGRELSIPGGIVLVGKMHRHAHLVQLLSGEATIVTDQGRERVVGPKTWVSPAGVKRALVTHTDCVFFTVHLNPTDTTDLDEIEAFTIVPEAIGHEAPQWPELPDLLQEVYA